MGRRAWANEVSFPLSNSEVSNLIEWYLLYFRTVLTIKFKMIAQNVIILTFKSKMAANAILKTKKKYYLLIYMCEKKQMKQLFLIKFGNQYLMERFLLCSEII